MGYDSKLLERLEKVEDPNLVIKLHAADYARLLFLNDRQFDEHQSLQRELRQLLRTGVE